MIVLQESILCNISCVYCKDFSTHIAMCYKIFFAIIIYGNIKLYMENNFIVLNHYLYNDFNSLHQYKHVCAYILILISLTLL